MKKILYLFTALTFFIACTEEGGSDFSDKTTDETYSATDGFGSESGSGSGSGSDTSQNPNGIQPGQITAGEWNDLQDWNFWLNLQKTEEFAGMPAYWDYHLNSRISVLLNLKKSEPAIDIEVQLLNNSNEILWEARTDNFGKAELWPSNKYGEQTQLNELKIKVGDELFTKVLTYSEGVNTFIVNSTVSEQKKIDIAFMVDATGSMSDELEFLKVELIDVINEVKSNNSSAAVNLGTVFYRDEGDDYVTRKSDFDSDISTTINFINQQQAGGGGDTPEAVHTALNKSINELQWSSDATSRLLFIVLDAPPHYETQIVSDIHQLVLTAAKKGIKIIPITASGIDKETEFLMRYMAIASNGTYVFITNHSGIGGEHLEPSIGQYDVELLNELLVRLINKYLE